MKLKFSSATPTPVMELDTEPGKAAKRLFLDIEAHSGENGVSIVLKTTQNPAKPDDPWLQLTFGKKDRANEKEGAPVLALTDSSGEVRVGKGLTKAMCAQPLALRFNEFTNSLEASHGSAAAVVIQAALDLMR